MKSEIMKRAWALWKNNTMGWHSFGDCLKAAWDEAKGLLIICEEIEIVQPSRRRELEAQEVMYLVAIGRVEITAAGQVLAL